MPIPERHRPPDIDPDEMKRFRRLCDQIELALENSDSVTFDRLLSEWAERCGPTERSDFQYHGSMSQKQFVRLSLWRHPAPVSDLTFEEAVAVTNAINSAELKETLEQWAVSWLEANFPGANASDLLFYPEDWFGEVRVIGDQLSAAQIVRYLCLASGRDLPGTPTDIPLPHPLPERR